VSPAVERKYVLDTNLFIRAFREPGANAELQRFHEVFAPFEYLSAVVAQELRAGARSTAARRLLERHVLSVFARRDRVREAGVVLVTDNLRNFERIQRRAPFQFVGPWPLPRG
jgi:predicted nucleic acid-binding protein